jgi:hypothetical protein
MANLLLAGLPIKAYARLAQKALVVLRLEIPLNFIKKLNKH